MKSKKHSISIDYTIVIDVSFTDWSFESDDDYVTIPKNRNYKYNGDQLLEYDSIVGTVMSAIYSRRFKILKIGYREKSGAYFYTVQSPKTNNVILVKFRLKDIRGTDICTEYNTRRYFRRFALNDVEYCSRAKLLFAMIEHLDVLEAR